MSSTPEEQKPISFPEKGAESISQPMYKNISATYFPAHPSQQQFCQKFIPNSDGVIIVQPIVQGVPVTANDQNTITQPNPRGFNPRRLFWNYPRRAQNFVCLNVCYGVILAISLNSCFSDYNEYKTQCPKFAQANFFYGIEGIVWVLFSIIGIYAALKKVDKLLKIYLAGISIIVVLTIITTAYGLLAQDPQCEDDPPKKITLIGGAVFTVFILGLFAYTATKLRRMIPAIPPPQRPTRPPQRL